MAEIIECRRVESLSDFIDAIEIRVDVFVKEQGFEPGWEPDEDDKTAEQFLAVDDGKPVATLRVRKTGESEFKIERMAVRKEFRAQGVGQALLDYVVGELKKTSPKKIWLQSQLQAQQFYEKNGFAAVSEAYELFGRPHVDMQYALGG